MESGQFDEQCDMAHLVPLRRLREDIADGGILACMIAVPSTGWNVACCRRRPLRSSDHLWELAESKDPLSPSGLNCLKESKCTMRAAINATVSTSPGPSRIQQTLFCWAMPHLGMFVKQLNVQKMTFDLCAIGTKWRKCTTVLAGHVDSVDALALGNMRCHGRGLCTFTNETHLQLVGYDPVHCCSRTLLAQTHSTKLARKHPNLLWGPPSPPECRELRSGHAMGERAFFAQSLSCGIRAALLFQTQRPCHVVWRHFPEQMRAWRVISC